MAISINGTTGISGVDGSASTPALQGNDSNTGISFGTDEVAINTGGTARVTVNSSGNVGIGTTIPAHRLDIYGTTAKLRVRDTDQSEGIEIYQQNSDGGNRVFAVNNNYLALGTNNAERARITSGGDFCVGKASADYAVNGGFITSTGIGIFTASSDRPLGVNRKVNDGILIELWQDQTQEGSISVSGTTVSYNGAHLSRWSQISGVDPHDKGSRPDILRGTVMTNLDEMCEWIDPESGDPQANEQLNKTKVSDTDDDPNVAGVFQSWDDDDDTWVNDYYLAMTGDFVIRIASDITVQRGDLLVSAGDGTARPQGDRCIKDSTIAKVTSTTVSHVHPDGSYCVPCVLMAC